MGNTEYVWVSFFGYLNMQYFLFSNLKKFFGKKITYLSFNRSRIKEPTPEPVPPAIE